MVERVTTPNRAADDMAGTTAHASRRTVQKPNEWRHELEDLLAQGRDVLVPGSP
jgi:hypothetical protein